MCNIISFGQNEEFTQGSVSNYFYWQDKSNNVHMTCTKQLTDIFLEVFVTVA